jgi:hypothetical protein
MSDPQPLRSPVSAPVRPRRAEIARGYWPLATVVAVLVIMVSLFPSVQSETGFRGVPLRELGVSLAGKKGVTRGGYECGPGIRQVPWSKYAPLCEPLWHGNNGGATWQGVTADTITITVRRPNATALGSLQNLFAPTLGTFDQQVATMRGYIEIFNKTFELYGRHVVLKVLNGKGDFLAELQGRGLEEAREDALLAKKLGAFADVSLLASSRFYDQYLANEGVIAIGAIAQPSSWFKAYAPYEYSPSPSCDIGVRATAVFMGHSLAGLPAIFAPDPKLRTKQRVFGLIFPEDPNYASCGELLVRLVSERYGIKFARVIQYSISVSQEPTEASNAISQMISSGVTTIMCGCDPIFPLLLAADAAGQNYYPEWLSLDFIDAFTQLYNQSEWAHAISSGLLLPPKSEQEAYRVWKLYFHSEPPSPQFAQIYAPLVLLFDGLQAAGPHLTPKTFQEGFFRLPPSLPGGDYGSWVFGQDRYVPIADFDILIWDKSAISPEDGRPGTYVGCFNGRRFPLSEQGAAQLPYHKQLQCPQTPD